jgi:hypothetical protein
MTKEEIKEIVEQALNLAESDSFGLELVNISNEPVDGYWYVMVEPAKLEPYSVLDYYTLLSEIEQDLSARGDIRVLLTPAINGSAEYKIEGQWIEVIERESGTFSAMPKRSHGGPRYSATFWPDGNLALTGTSGLGRLEPPPADWIDRFQKAVKLHLEVRQHPQDASA